MHDSTVTLFLCGDVMLGRGVDQILPHPGDPELREGWLADSRSYVELAERANGPIPRPVPFAWPWGAALPILDEAAPDVRVVNLETAVTGDGEFAPGKAVHYRMNPANLPCLAQVRPDVCVLANNHVLDFGRAGLDDTLQALSDAGLRTAGAGRDADEAGRPAAVPVGEGRRVLVFGCGSTCSGIPDGWAAAEGRPGVHLLPDLSDRTADELTARIRQARRPGDVTVVSVHWGSNWGYEVPAEQVRFAHRLVDGGVDVIHGHSSHHPRPVEVYRDRLVLYGCGDFVDDYEGITGYEAYRDDLRLIYLVSVDADTGALRGLRMIPLQARWMRLWPADPGDVDWLRAVLDRVCARFGAQFAAEPDGAISLLLPERQQAVKTAGS